MKKILYILITIGISTSTFYWGKHVEYWRQFESMRDTIEKSMFEVAEKHGWKVDKDGNIDFDPKRKYTNQFGDIAVDPQYKFQSTRTAITLTKPGTVIIDSQSAEAQQP